MTALACVFLVLGEIALWLDLGNRLFGSYARTPVGSLARITLIVIVLVALGIPLVWLWIDSTSRLARIVAYSSALLGALAFVHFLFPYRWRIVRVAEPATTSTRPLVPGIVLSSATVELPSLPQSADGMTCLVLSDLHCNGERQLQLLCDAVAQIQDKPPDLVLLLGDFGENSALLPQVVAAVTKLSGRLGTYCVLGNHDYEGGRQSILTELLRERSVRILTDEFHELPELGVALLGLAYPWSRTPRLPGPREGFALGMTHSPDNLPYCDRIGVAFAVAGHTHGGKLRMPGIGAVLVPSRLGRFFDEGWFRRGATLLYLTRGIGYLPGRFGSNGEICWFRLRTAPVTRIA
jgi:predicted MPP superfamily phosphohydrolase